MCEQICPVLIPKGSTTPYLIKYNAFSCCGKYPGITVRIDNGDNTTVIAPLITVTEIRDSDGYITSLYVNDTPDGNGKTNDDLIITLKK